MKTHLPVALRKSLLAALVAVSFAQYNKLTAAEYIAPANQQISTGEEDVVMEIDTNVEDSTIAMGKGNTVETTSGNVIVNGDVSDGNTVTSESGKISINGAVVGAGNTLTITGEGGIEIESLKDGADSLHIKTESTDIVIGAVANTLSNGDDKKALDTVDALKIESESGNLKIGLSAGAISHADINVGGDIMIGGETPDEGGDAMLEIRGTADNPTGIINIYAGGDMRVNQNVDIRPGDGNHGGTLEIEVDGSIQFNGSITKIQGGGVEMTGEAVVRANGPITFTNREGTVVAGNALIETKVAGSDISLNNGGALNEITGSLSSAGKVDITGGTNHVWGADENSLASISAANGVEIRVGDAENAVVENSIHKAKISTASNGIKIIGDESVNQNYAAYSEFDATEGDISMIGAQYAIVTKSQFMAHDGDVVLNSEETQVSDSSVEGHKVDIIATKSNLIQQGSHVTANDTDVTMQAAENTITGSENEMTKVEAKGNVSMIAEESNVIMGAQTQVIAGDGDVNINGGITSDNIIDDALVSARDADSGDGAKQGTVEMIGKTNVVRNQGEIQAANGITLNAQGTDEQDGNLVSHSTLTSDDGNITMSAAQSNSVEEGAWVTATGGSVSMSGSAMNRVIGATTQVIAGDGDVNINGGITSDNIIDDALVSARDADSEDGEGQGTVEMIGKTNVVRNQGEIQAANGITLNAQGTDEQDGNLVSHSTLTSDDGNITMSAAQSNSVEEGAWVTATGGSVSMSGSVMNRVIGATTQVIAGDGDVNINGGITSDNIIDDALVSARDADSEDGAKQGTVEMIGKTNVVRNQGEIQAANGITLNAQGTDEQDGNLVSHSTLTSDDGNITMSAAQSNSVEEGAWVTATGGSVSMSGSAMNRVIGATTQVIAGDGDVNINGGITSDNIIDDALVSASLADSGDGEGQGTVEMIGKTNVVRNQGEIQAANGITLNAQGTDEQDGNLVSNSTLTSDDGNITMSAAQSNSVEEGAWVTATGGSVSMSGSAMNRVIGATTQVIAGDGDVNINGGITSDNIIDDALVSARDADSEDGAKQGTVEMIGKTNVVRNQGDIQAANGITLNAQGTDEQDGNLVSNSTLTSDDGNITMSAAQSNSVEEGAWVTATGGSVSMSGSVMNRVVGATTQVIAGDGDVNINGGITSYNIIDNALVSARDADSEDGAKQGTVEMIGKGNAIINGAAVQADYGVYLESNGELMPTESTEGDGNVVAASTVNAASGDVTMKARLSNTIEEGAWVTATGGSVSMSGSVMNRVVGATTQVIAGDGDVNINGGTTSYNIIDDALVSARDADSEDGAKQGTVEMIGKTNVVRNQGEIQAANGITLNAQGTDEQDGNLVSNSTLTSDDGNITMSAAQSNSVEEGAWVTATGGSVSMSGSVMNRVVGATTQVIAGDGDVNINGGITSYNIIDDALVSARDADSEDGAKQGTVEMIGKTNVVRNQGEIQAANGITLNAQGTDEQDGNLVSNSTLTSDDGNITMSAAQSNSVEEGAWVTATGGSVSMSGSVMNRVIGATTQVIAGDGDVNINGGTTSYNIIDDALVSARDADSEDGAKQGTVEMIGKGNAIINGAAVQADYGVYLESNGELMPTESTEGDGNVVAASTVNAASGDVTMKARLSNTIEDKAQVTAQAGSISMDGGMFNTIGGEGTQVTAGNGDVTMNGEETGMNRIIGAQVLAQDADAEDGVDVGKVDLSGKINIIRNGADVQAAHGVRIESVGETSGDGNLIAAASVTTATGDMYVDAAMSNSVQDAAEITATSGNVKMTAEEFNVIQGGSLVKGYGDVHITSMGEDMGANVVTGDGTGVTSETGNVIINAQNANQIDSKAQVLAEDGSIYLGDSPMTRNYVKTGAILTAEEDVVIKGEENVITSEDATTAERTTITAVNGDINISQNSQIKYATVRALGKDGDVLITTGIGDAETIIHSSTVTGGNTVTVVGDITNRSTDNLAVVSGRDTKLQSEGESEGIGLTLNNVSIVDTDKEQSNVVANGGGDIVILNRVDVQNGALTIGLAPDAVGNIRLDAPHVLNMKRDSVLSGGLTGNGVINKSGGDALVLDYDHTAFSGIIYANGVHSDAAEMTPGVLQDGSVYDTTNTGSWIAVAGPGLNENATIALRNTDLVIQVDGAQIGTLDTTSDAEHNVSNGGTLQDDGTGHLSYTTDGGTRADFKTIGSVVQVNAEQAGDVVYAKNLYLSDATLLKLDATVDAEGVVIADRIEASGTIDTAANEKPLQAANSTATAPLTARVYIEHTHLDAANHAEEGSRATILMGAETSNINEDVLYALKQENGTYQRQLQNRNVHLEQKDGKVDLVFSKNYRGCAKDEQLASVANALNNISATLHHSEGYLAASTNRLHNLVDAFDYTRSETAARNGLVSVMGTVNVLPRMMMFDSSRHHLSQLRKQMQMPVCPDLSGKAFVLEPTKNVWMTYIGTHDELDGTALMPDYSRDAHGVLLGIDKSVNCQWRLGGSVGYEYSTAESGSASVDANTFYADVYAAGMTGRVKHRASAGVALSRYETTRHVFVDAGYHTFSGTGNGEIDSLSLNFGYEISADFRVGSRGLFTPYAAFTFAWHRLDDMHESGMGEAGLVSRYGNEWQSEIQLGANYSREFNALLWQAPGVFYLNAAMHIETFNDRVSVRNRFSGSGESWTVESMEREPIYFEVGAGVAVPLSPHWIGTAGAAFEFGADRSSFSGNIGATYRF